MKHIDSLKISIITIVLNQEKTISKSIKSIVDQDYKRKELIVIDGCSEDNTINEINKYSSNINFFISVKDNGIYHALNRGIRLATGDIIGFVHGDDFLLSNTILSEISLNFSINKVDGIYGNLEYVKKHDSSSIVRSWISRPYYPEMIKKAWMPPHPTLFLRKEVYEKHGYFDTSFKISADYEFIIRIFKDQYLKFEYLPKTITRMRLGGISNGSFRNIALKVKEDYRAMRKHKVGNIFTLARKTLSKLDQYFKS